MRFDNVFFHKLRQFPVLLSLLPIARRLMKDLFARLCLVALIPSLLIAALPTLARAADDEAAKVALVRELRFTDLDGKSYSLKAVDASKALVLVFVTTDCPIANSYQPSLARLHKEFQDSGFIFAMVHEGPDQTPEKLKAHAKEYAISIPVVMDDDHKIARLVGATKTPEAIVIGMEGAILYQGRIDDLYPSFGKKRAVATREDLRVALRELDAGQSVHVPKTDAVGCLIQLK